MTELPTTVSFTAPSANDHIPVVSIGMPVYNGAKYIKEALDSLLAQTFSDFELIISDNASTDETREICEEYAGKDKRIKYVRQAENMGGLANFNYVFDHAKGRYFSWLACDDALEPGFLEKIVRYLDQFEDVVACACDFKLVNEHEELIRIERLEGIYPSTDWSYSQEHFFMFPLTNVYFAIYGVFRREKLENAGIKNKSTWLGLASGNETPFLCRVAALGRIVAIPEVLRVYRIHSHSMYNTEQKKTALALLWMHNFLLRLDQFYIAIVHPIPFYRKPRLFLKMIMFTINDFMQAIKRRL